MTAKCNTQNIVIHPMIYLLSPDKGGEGKIGLWCNSFSKICSPQESKQKILTKNCLICRRLESSSELGGEWPVEKKLREVGEWLLEATETSSDASSRTLSLS